MQYYTPSELESQAIDSNFPSIFVFFSGSRAVNPGFGVKECAKRQFDELEHNFREQLSNFYPCEIVAEDGRRFPSAEHFFHAEKTALVDTKRAKLFEHGEKFGLLEPKFTISKTGKNKKTGLEMGDKLKEWDETKDNVLKKIWRLKFSQNAKLKSMLLETKDARLIHYMKKRGSKPLYQRWCGLEEIRDELK